MTTDGFLSGLSGLGRNNRRGSRPHNLLLVSYNRPPDDFVLQIDVEPRLITDGKQELPVSVQILGNDVNSTVRILLTFVMLFE